MPNPDNHPNKAAPLDAWIIEEIRKREQEKKDEQKRREEQPTIEIDEEPPTPPSEKDKGPYEWDPNAPVKPEISEEDPEKDKRGSVTWDI